MLALLACGESRSAALAEEGRGEIPAFSGMTGLGIVSDRSGGANAYFVFGDMHTHLRQREASFGIRQYGFAQTRLEAGQGIGFGVAATTGITLVGIRGRETVSPHLGVEPFSFRLSLHSAGARVQYYQWFPAVSGGLQFQFGSCRALPVARAGVSAGNPTHPGLWPRVRGALGLATYLNCEGTDLAVEALRVDEGGAALDSATLDLSVGLPRSSWKVSLRGEMMVHRPVGARIDERRILIGLRRPPMY